MLLERLGGIFAILTFWHFFADWTFQSHKEALAKSSSVKVRLCHCTKYTAIFAPILYFTVTWPVVLIASAILFYTHFIIDSYVPVMMWAKYLRKMPQFETLNIGPSVDRDAFLAMAGTPLGMILIITMDQLLHIAVLLPIAWLMLK